jgi:hypothetical protein
MRVADVVDAYLTRQRSLGMRFETAGQLLLRFSRAMGDRPIQEVTPELLQFFPVDPIPQEFNRHRKLIYHALSCYNIIVLWHDSIFLLSGGGAIVLRCFHAKDCPRFMRVAHAHHCACYPEGR